MKNKYIQLFAHTIILTGGNSQIKGNLIYVFFLKSQITTGNEDSTTD